MRYCDLCDRPARWWIFREDDPYRPVRACAGHVHAAGPGERDPIPREAGMPEQVGAILGRFWAVRGRQMQRRAC